VSLSESLSVTN